MGRRREAGFMELVRNQQNLLRSVQLADAANSSVCPIKRQELAAKARLAFLASGVAPAEALAMLLGVIGGSCGPEAAASEPSPTLRMLTRIADCLERMESRQEAAIRPDVKSLIPRAVDALGEGLSAERLGAGQEAMRQQSGSSTRPPS